MNNENTHLSIDELKMRINQYKNYPPVNEMVKLKAALDEDNIIWEDMSDERITRTHITIGDSKISVINGIGTYGGEDLFAGNNEGLLEIRINGDEPIGWRTARQVMLIIYYTIMKEKLNVNDNTH